MFDCSDDYDFSPTDGSKLASLFGTTEVAAKDVNNSLTYKAPKQPKNKDANRQNAEGEGTKSNIQTKALSTKIALLWKLENREYKALGKHVFAIIGSPELNIYELLVYKEKSNIIIRTKINEGFSLLNQQNNFSSFCDSRSQYWLVKFEDGDQKEFSDILTCYGATVNVKTTGTSKEVSGAKIIKPDLLPKPEPYSSAQSKVEGHESDSSDSHKRAELLNRISKMGQQVISGPLTQRSDVSDSDEPDCIERKSKSSKKPKQGLYSKKLSVPAVIQYGNQQPEFESNSFSNQGVAQYFMTQNAELKMHLAYISAKLDGITINSNNKPTDCVTTLKSKIKTLELVRDNLQTALENSEKKCMQLQQQQQQTSKIDDAKRLSEEVERLHLELENANKHELSVNEEYQTKIKMYEDIVNSQMGRIQELEKSCEKSVVEELQPTTSKSKIEFGRSQTHSGEETIATLAQLIKDQMNSMYQSVISNFDESSSYTIHNIQMIVAGEIKKATFGIIKDVQKTLQSESLPDI